MRSAFGIDHGYFSKELHPLGFGNQPRIKHDFHPPEGDDAPKQLGRAARAVNRVKGKGKVGLALAGGGALTALGGYTANKTIIQPAHKVTEQQRQRRAHG